jgi:MoxR-like ATPase
MDRFMLKEVLQYPTPQEEAEVIFRIEAGVYEEAAPTRPVASLDDIRGIQAVVKRIHIDPVIVQYVTHIVAATRTPHQILPPQLARLIECGASPRATIAFCRAARALALLNRRDHVLPDDIKALAHRVLRHRLMLGFEAAADHVTPEIIIDAVLGAVRTP